jgi:hypothetical protein
MAADPIYRQRAQIESAMAWAAVPDLADEDLVARDRVLARLDQGTWQPTRDVVLRRPALTFTQDEKSSQAIVDVDPIELRVMRSLATTHPKGQFAVAKTGATFTASTKGFSRETDRIYLTGLSPLIDAIGAFMFEFREDTDQGIGGRFLRVRRTNHRRQDGPDNS